MTLVDVHDVTVRGEREREVKRASAGHEGRGGVKYKRERSKIEQKETRRAREKAKGMHENERRGGVSCP